MVKYHNDLNSSDSFTVFFLFSITMTTTHITILSTHPVPKPEPPALSFCVNTL